MPQSTALSPDHEALITELCDELTLSVAQTDTVLVWCKQAYKRRSGPTPTSFPETNYSGLGADARRQMRDERMRSFAPFGFHVLLDMAIDAEASKTNRRLARAAIKRQIRQLVRGT